MNDALAIFEMDGALSYVNDAFLELWGYKNRHEVLGKYGRELWRDRASADAMMAELGETGRWEGGMDGINADRKSFPVEVEARIERARSDLPLYMLLSVTKKMGGGCE